jgi:asparagine N-glycosylation enzyme membrane subunit Stt3
MITALLYVLIAALLPWLLVWVLIVLSFMWVEDSRLVVLVVRMLFVPLIFGTPVGLVVGIVGGLNNGGWFVVLQKIAHRRLARAGNLPSPPYDFLEWGIEKQIFRRVGGGVRFRHNLIQQHLASTSN